MKLALCRVATNFCPYFEKDQNNSTCVHRLFYEMCTNKKMTNDINLVPSDTYSQALKRAQDKWKEKRQ